MTQEEKKLPEGLEEAAEKWATTTHFEWPNQVPAGKKGFKDGAKWMKAKMLEGAVEGEVAKVFPEGEASIHYNPGCGIGEMAYFCKADGLAEGDKVKILIVKEN